MTYHKKSTLGKLQIGGVLKVKIASSFDRANGWYDYYSREYTVATISRKSIIGEIVVSEEPFLKEKIEISRKDIDCGRFIILT